jgi:GNAT superfamily N-acetyltransferase
MDGNTWRRYRFVTARGNEPSFFLEPDHPDSWPADWTAAGFQPLATYFSALNTDLARTDADVTRAGERLRARGIRVRALDPSRFAEELRRIFAVSVRSFPGNFLYTPIAEEEFLNQYCPIRQHVVPELVLIAEEGGEAVGYIFALPDLLAAAHGPVKTVIIKTVAVLPERRCAGLGVFLVQEVQHIARKLGYARAIHALMHESNNSRNLSARYAKPFRRYTLYSRTPL